MDDTTDELAGVVDLFGGLTREELAEALTELAFRRGEDVERDAVDDAIASAREDYALVAVDADADGTGDDLLVPGPVAFPTMPEGSEDLPHILDVDRRDVDREAKARAFRRRVAAEIADDPGAERVEFLLDVTYDAETWAPIDAADLRERLEQQLDGQAADAE